MKKNEKGQLTIFLGIGLMVIITLLAFIINVGLFVKAKINLQNAVDAAAWSGAAVQARQLSNISYLNWEMRNSYKEWMFKYYVLGQLSLKKLRNLHTPAAGDALAAFGYNWQKEPNRMNFRLVPFWKPTQGSYYKPNSFDKYNLPSTCISFSSTHNICELYAVAGLPRFETNGLMGVSEHNEAFLNKIVAQKSKDCSMRSDLNFSVAMNWVYGIKQVTFEGAPEIASNRTGAWVQAMELAIRIRNLEAIVNRAPVDMPICLTGDNCLSVNSLEGNGGSAIPINERPIKAFWSAYKNLGGEPDETNDLKGTFKLTELAPNPLYAEPNSLSGMLIPNSRELLGTGHVAAEKFYLDLIPMPLNLATMFTTFATATEADFGGSTVPSEASCLGSKTALPVPGYIFGFFKNPKVITYYAVKGEANFMGLFFPFVGNGVPMKAYATAKPFGGRIGPKLFEQNGTNGITPNSGLDSGQQRSAPYISGLDLQATATYKPGEVLPTVQDFWVRNATDVVGGIPGTQEIKFAIPNLLYDLEEGADSSSIDSQADSLSYIMNLNPAINEAASRNIHPDEDLGLYNKKQFELFIKNIDLPPGAIDLTPELVQESLERVRAPTRYEALNYLIPTYEDPSDDETGGFDSVPVVNNVSGDKNRIFYRLFAPLYGAGTLYDSPEQIKTTLYQYIRANEVAINVYLDSLKAASDNIRTASASAQDKNAYIAAANGIWQPDPDCASIAGRFRTFFLTDSKPSPANCEINSLSNSISEFFSSEYSGDNALFYSSSYRSPSTGNASIMTAYMPGPRSGASESGEMTHPFDVGVALTSKRNFYSTKLIATEKIVNGSTVGYNQAGVYTEIPQLGAQDVDFANALDRGLLQEFGVLTH